MAILGHRIRSVLSVTSAIYVISLLLSSAIRAHIVRIFSPTAHPIRFLILTVSILLNAKSIPFAWHVRLFGAMINQLHLPRPQMPKDALFKPIVTSAIYTPLVECDYNIHKSNSTYFADLDISRTQLITTLLRKGIRNANRYRKIDGSTELPAAHSAGIQTAGENASVRGRFMIALGGVTCHFKREIKPYEKFEIWTRVLSWDRKWVYLVSHMVRAGAVKPHGWALQPWRRSRGGRAKAVEGNGVLHGIEAEKRAVYKDAIFASSISKYVVKFNRRTIAPEIVLQRSDLLPPKPAEGMEEESAGNIGDWTWAAVEAERVRGLRLAESFGILDELHDEFPVIDDSKGIEVLGDFPDMFSV